jgi:hypothetical protein
LPENKVFGPLNIDNKILTERITDYELHVFNRFGKEVFSSTDFSETWDGTDGTVQTDPDNYSHLNEMDVYVWYCIYKYGNCDISLKGDITLYR